VYIPAAQAAPQQCVEDLINGSTQDASVYLYACPPVALKISLSRGFDYSEVSRDTGTETGSATQRGNFGVFDSGLGTGGLEIGSAPQAMEAAFSCYIEPA